MNWVFATNSDFISPHIFATQTLYVKHWILFDKTVLVWNIKGVHHEVGKMKGLENSSLWRRLIFSVVLSIICEGWNDMSCWVKFDILNHKEENIKPKMHELCIEF